MEYLNASLGSAESPLGGTTSTALPTKALEWSTEQPPLRVDWGLHRAFKGSPTCTSTFSTVRAGTPFAGVGVGWAAAELNYYLRFIRKPEAEYLQIEFDPDWPDIAKRAAAGTVSILDTYASETVFGYQVLVGVDYALSGHTSLGGRAALGATRRYRP